MLEVREVGIHFGALSAVSQVSLMVDEGELVGLIGPNGAGKTTFFNLLSGHYAPTSGDVILDGRRISGSPPWKVARAGIARTFQNPRVFPKLTCRENVEAAADPNGWRSWIAPARSVRANADRWLEFAGMAHLADALSGSLSYGHLRRLEIARACARNPRLLLLDEPAAGMNSSERSELSELIRRINANGTAVLLIEHNMPLVLGLCERVAVLNFGELLAEGSPEQIRDNPAVVEAYLGAEDATTDNDADDTFVDGTARMAR